MNKMLQTLQKYVGNVEGLEDVRFMSKNGSIGFGEGSKAINEFIGYLQVLNFKLDKLQNIVSRIEISIEESNSQIDDVPQNISANINMSEILISQAKDIIQNTKFVDKNLFDTELSASMGDFTVSFEMESPLYLLQSRKFNTIISYVDSKKEEIKVCMEALRALSDSKNMSEHSLRGRTIGEALQIVLN